MRYTFWVSKRALQTIAVSLLLVVMLGISDYFLTTQDRDYKRVTNRLITAEGPVHLTYSNDDGTLGVINHYQGRVSAGQRILIVNHYGWLTGIHYKTTYK